MTRVKIQPSRSIRKKKLNNNRYDNPRFSSALFLSLSLSIRIFTFSLYFFRETLHDSLISATSLSLLALSLSRIRFVVAMASFDGSRRTLAARPGGKIVRPRRTAGSRTPYERPRVADSEEAENPSWISRLILSPSRAIAAGAGKLVTSVFSQDDDDSDSDSDSDSSSSSSDGDSGSGL